jgi:hypothetical protein
MTRISTDHFGTTAWTTVSFGRSVVRDCRGRILAQFLDPTIAALLRQNSRTIVL